MTTWSLPRPRPLLISGQSVIPRPVPALVPVGGLPPHSSYDLRRRTGGTRSADLHLANRFVTAKDDVPSESTGRGGSRSGGSLRPASRAADKGMCRRGGPPRRRRPHALPPPVG